MSSLTAFSFSRQHRLLKQVDFRALFKNGKRFYLKGLVIYTLPAQEKIPRLGISISKKNINKANRRNHIKRQIRESFRLAQKNISQDFVIVVQRRFAQYDSIMQRKLIDEIWARYRL